MRRLQTLALAMGLTLALSGAGGAAVPPPTPQAGTSGAATFTDPDGKPLAGIAVELVNLDEKGKRFRFETEEDGSFRFEKLRLTPIVRLSATGPRVFRPIDLEIPSSALASQRTFRFSAARVRVSGRVELSDEAAGRAEPVARAAVFAIAGERRVHLVNTDEDGRFATNARLADLGDSENVTLEVRLPAQLTLAARFEPGATLRHEASLEDGRCEAGTLHFVRLDNPETTATLSGFYYVRDSLDDRRYKGIEGLVFRARNARTGETVGKATTRDGRWSMTLPTGDVVIDAPNARKHGLIPATGSPLRVEFDTPELRNGSVRPAPEQVAVANGRLTFAYKGLGPVRVEEAALRVDGGFVERDVAVRREGDRYAVDLDERVPNGTPVQVAVEVDGLLTRFSAPTKEGDNQ